MNSLLCSWVSSRCQQMLSTNTLGIVTSRMSFASIPSKRRRSVRRGPLTSKQGNKNWVKGNRCRKMGWHIKTKKGTTGFLLDETRVPIYAVPDLEGCELKPYVAQEWIVKISKFLAITFHILYTARTNYKWWQIAFRYMSFDIRNASLIGSRMIDWMKKELCHRRNYRRNIPHFWKIIWGFIYLQFHSHTVTTESQNRSVWNKLSIFLHTLNSL